MKKIVGFVLGAVVAAMMLTGGVVIGAPAAYAADCAENAILPAADGSGTYSLCTGGQFVHLDQQLCVDYPDFAPNCTATPASSTASPTPIAPPPPVIAPPPVIVDTPNVNVPNPHLGCTYVNGYTRKSGTHVSGYWRC